MLKVKRVYEPPSPEDGKRILVDRLWPRGLTREDAAIDEWMKDLAPNSDLRKWFGHDPGKWTEFRKRFFRELDAREEQIQTITKLARKGRVTLLFGSREERFNNAVALLEYIEGRMHGSHRKKAA